jgi:hypothetical protein
VPYKGPTSPIAIESQLRRSRKYESTHREERREQKRDAYWRDPNAERERNRELKARWRSDGKCVNCGSENDCLPKTLCSRCVPQIAAATKRWHLKLRQEAFNAYGGPQCACCGILIDEFLTIDHINGGGNRQKEELGGGGVKLYAWLKRMGYPPGFQVLCMNCNFAKGKYGQCPHERVRDGD